MWYVNLNGRVLPTPYQQYRDGMDECERLKRTMIAVIVYPVLIQD
jgi:hypothetical protein